MFIIVLRCPIGDAPPWVEQAWIGMRLPVVEQQRRPGPAFGLFPKTDSLAVRLRRFVFALIFGVTGYVVDAKVAVLLMEGVDPPAAEWLRANWSEWLDAEHGLFFDRESCRSISSDALIA